MKSIVPEVVAIIRDGEFTEELRKLILANEGSDFIILRRARDKDTANALSKRYHDYSNGISQLRKMLSQLEVEDRLRTDLWKAKLVAVSRTVDAFEQERELLRQILIDS